MTRSLPRCAAMLALMLAGGGCTTPGPSNRYPSLLPRAIETRSDAEPVVTPVAAVADPAADAAVAALRKTLVDAQARFEAAAATTDRAAAAAKGDAVGGERWIAAQAGLADLDALRASTSGALTEIDDLALARAADGKPPYPALEALRGEAQTAADAQGARIAAIQARLPGA